MIWMALRKSFCYLANQIYVNLEPKPAMKFYIANKNYCTLNILLLFDDTIINVVHSIPS